jgi:hypothetical protein
MVMARLGGSNETAITINLDLLSGSRWYAGDWVLEDVPFNALYDALGQLTSLQAQGTSPV